MGQLRRDDGQAFVEFVLILPLVVGVLFALIEMGIALNDYLRVTDAARIGARAAAVARFNPSDQDPCDAARAAINSQGGDFDFKPGWCVAGLLPNSIKITVQKDQTIDIPFLPVSKPDITLSSSATEKIE